MAKSAKTLSAGEKLTESDRQKSSVQSLAKGLRVLEAFGGDDEALTITEIAERADLDPGTTFRMLNTLVDLGYVHRLEKRRYAISLKVLDLGFNAIGRRDLRSVVRPVLRSLVGGKIEAASFGVLDGGNVVYVERVRAGLTRLGVDIRIGSGIPAAINVLGHAILAFLPATDLDQVLASDATQSGYPVVSRARLLPQLDSIRRNGFAASASQISAGLDVLAVPVCDEGGYPIAAISVAAPSVVCSLAEMQEIVLARLQKAAGDIAKVMQMSGSSRVG
jgi:IclR family transcriptional regulator, pca regulon regulatory protein